MIKAAGRLAALLLCCILIGGCILPIAATAAGVQEKEKTVRVGWYESPFNSTDAFGRRSGYAYDYQKKIAAYAGWNYEYVEGSWPDLLQMLIDGEIDLMSDVSYTDERAETMLFSSMPMGAEEYYIFISPDNDEINKDDLSTFNGKKVGANKGSVQVGFFREWAKENGVEAEIVEMTESVEESLEMLRRGDIDMYVVLNGYLDKSYAVPITRVGASDFYFSVNKSRPDLLSDLNAGMERIQEENHTYQQRLYEKYFKTSGINYYANTAEKTWLSDHGAIRVGYRDDFMPFCASDKKTGDLTGALKEYLDSALTCFENAELSFEPTAYPSADASFEALKNGETDCIFPCNLSVSDGEALGVDLTPAIMSTEVYVVVQEASKHTILQKGQVTAAMPDSDPNYVSIIKDHFPDWQYRVFADIQACLQAVADGDADCMLISNYQTNHLARQYEKLRLTAVATGEYVDDCFAVRAGDTELFSILTRTSDIISKTRINVSLASYAVEETETTLVDFIRENPAVAVAAFVVVAAIVIIIIAQQRIIRAKREIKETHQQVDDLSKRVYVDALTSVRNKAGFDKLKQGLQNRLDNGESLSFAVVMLDCNDLKPINDRYGHEKGDIYLQTACGLICRTYKFSPVFRIGGDEFAVVLQNEDYRNREELVSQLKKNAREISHSAENEWDKVNLAVGMADYNPHADTYVDDVVRRADIKMYENKRVWKNEQSGGKD